MIKYIYSLVFVILIVLNVNAQKAPMKFGKIDEVELEMKVDTEFPEASAVVLGDYGVTGFTYSDIRGWQHVLERHVRIKILNKEGYEYANVEIPFYEGSNGNKEKISSFKAYTYNLTDGKIIKDKVDKDAIFEEKVNENWYQSKFTFPNVVEGSIIEYSYKITSDFLFNLTSWGFQTTIPVKYSEYRLTIPEYFKYQQIFQGYERLAIVEDNKKTEKFVVKYTSNPGAGGKVEKSTNEMTSNSTSYRWVAENLPEIGTEPYMTTYLDYITQLRFQLISIQYPGQMPNLYMGTYEGEFNKGLLESERFGKVLTKVNFADWLPQVIANAKTETEKAIAIYEYVKSNMTWNDNNRVYTSGSLRSIYKEKTGSSADINLLLVGLLKEAGLNANPIVSSTRKNGKPHPVYPSMDKFNYVIAAAQIDGKMILMDATAKNYPINILPERALNGKGWLVSDSPRWVELIGDSGYKSKTTIKYTFNEAGLNVVIDKSKYGLDGITSRFNYLTKGRDDYFEGSTALDWSLTNGTVENEKDIYSPLIEHKEFTNEEAVLENIMYINPMIFGGLRENLFKNEKRKFPVDLPAPINETCMVEIKIPEGYSVEFPQSTVVALPKNGGTFKYSAMLNGDKVVIISILDITNTFYYGEDYLALRNFLDIVVAKHNEQVVFKKN